jgi:hypothetical protein
VEAAEGKRLGIKMAREINDAARTALAEEAASRVEEEFGLEQDLMRRKASLMEDSLVKLRAMHELEIKEVERAVQMREMTQTQANEKLLVLDDEYHKKALEQIKKEDQEAREIRQKTADAELEYSRLVNEGRLKALERAYDEDKLTTEQYLEEKRAIIAEGYDLQIEAFKERLGEAGLELGEDNVIGIRIQILEEEKNQALASVVDTTDRMKDLAKDSARTMTGALSGFTDNAIEDFHNMGEVFSQTILSMIHDLAQLTMQKTLWEPLADILSGAIGSAVGGIGGGTSNIVGGYDITQPIFGFQPGGAIPGSGTGDTVPIMGEAGEYILPKKRVQEIGLGYLDQLRRGFQEGGLVEDYSPFRVSWNAVYNPLTGWITFGGDRTFRGSVYDRNWLSRAMLSPTIVGSYQIWNTGMAQQPFTRPGGIVPPIPPTPPEPQPPGPEPEPPGPITPPEPDPEIPTTPPKEAIPDWLLPPEEGARVALPDWVESMYDIFGYTPRTGEAFPLVESKEAVNRWNLPAITQPTQDLLDQFGFKTSPLIGMPYYFFKSYGEWAEPLFALSLLTGMKSQYLTAVPGIAELLSSGFDSVIESVPGNPMNKEKTADILNSIIAKGKNPLDSNEYGARILTEVLNSLYYSLGTRGTMAVENPTVDYKVFDRMADFYRNAYDEYMDSSDLSPLKQKHAGYIYARGFYDYMVSTMAKALGTGTIGGIGYRPGWVSAYYGEGPGAPGAWLPQDYMKWGIGEESPAAASYAPFRPFPKKPQNEWSIYDFALMALFREKFPEWKKYTFHGGGLVGALEEGETILPKKYHEGGIVGREPGGGVAITPRVTINIQNQTGIRLEAEEEFSMADFEGVVKSIVLRAYSNDPVFRHMSGGRR